VNFNVPDLITRIVFDEVQTYILESSEQSEFYHTLPLNMLINMRAQYYSVVQELPSRVSAVLNTTTLFKTHFDELLKEIFVEI
jgi:hypothetical protein